MNFRIEFHDTVTSTNKIALERAELGEAEGLTLIVDYQTQGYGKFNRPWISPKGQNILLTILLRPSMAPSEAPLLTQLACRAVAKVLNDPYGIPTTFKRPNDILVAGKKICGILVETRSSGQRTVESMAVGIGLNVNSEASDLIETATSMKMVTGKQYNKWEIIANLLQEWDLVLHSIKSGVFH